jgi:hypothetical protein
MKRTNAAWTIALAAMLTALPASGFAQTDPPAAQPPAPTQTQPQTPAPPATAPQTTPNLEAAKQHLTAARDSLSQLTQLPAASQLSGDARTQISQLITNFNELISSKTDWQAAYAKVEANLTAILGPSTPSDPARPSGTPGAVGTTGTAATVDPSIRAKLVEFRSHLDQFEKAAKGAEPNEAAATPSPTPPASPTAPPSQPPSTPPTTPPAEPPPTGEPPTSPEISDSSQAMDYQQVLRHVEAIEAILNAQSAAQPAGGQPPAGAVGTSGTAKTGGEVVLSQVQVQQLRRHLAELRRMLEKK